jgi:hypothetical protein
MIINNCHHLSSIICRNPFFWRIYQDLASANLTWLLKLTMIHTYINIYQLWMAIFNSNLLVYQKLCPINIPILVGEFPIKITTKSPWKIPISRGYHHLSGFFTTEIGWPPAPGAPAAAGRASPPWRSKLCHLGSSWKKVWKIALTDKWWIIRWKHGGLMKKYIDESYMGLKSHVKHNRST